MVDLPGLILSFAAITLSCLAMAAELALPPRRPDWAGFLAANGAFAVFLAAVFLMYAATLVPAFNRPAVFEFLRTIAYLTNPLLAWAALRWLGDYLIVNPGIWKRRWLISLVAVLALCTVVGMVAGMTLLAVVGILVGRALLVAVLVYSLFASLRHNRSSPREPGAWDSVGVPAAALLFWAGLTLIEIRLDRHPEEIYPLNIWYVAGALLFGVWTGYSIISRRRRVSHGLAISGKAEDGVAVHVSPDGLSVREEEIARALILGRSYQEIAEELFISYGTVKTHVYRIYRKLGVRNKVELVQVMRG